jgi:tetrahydromethanopterin S-methyltransferase subunit G
MSLETLTNQVRELTRRLDLAETKLAQQAGQFEFISGQLRDVQLYMHARFSDVDQRFDRIDARFDRMDARFDRMDARLDKMDSKIDALPRVLAEMLAKR